MKEKITHRVPVFDSDSEHAGAARERFMPRETWGPGPWVDEPDRIEWETHAGLDALMVRSPVGGNWCGYVAVPPGHPLHGKGYGDDAASELNAHGGLTYADKCSGHICHVAEPGKPDDVWWFGFDCGHAFDVMPAMDATMRTIPGMPARPAMFDEHHEYRDVVYVRGVCEVLALQLAEAAGE